MKFPHEMTDDALDKRIAREVSQPVYRTLPAQAAADVAATLVLAAIDTHDTHRTDTAPERTYAPRVTTADRRSQFGSASSEAATYPTLAGAPVGSLPTLASAKREADAERSARIWAERNERAERAQRNRANRNRGRR